MQWLIARFQPTSLFSLKHGDATSTGGKTLLIPTPFAIRTALLDVAIRVDGVQTGPKAFDLIRAMTLAVQPPNRAAVPNIFVKVQKPERHPERTQRAMAPTIAFREYVHLAGELGLAFGGPDDSLAATARWLPHVTYFGKRGSFFQLLELPEQVSTAANELPDNFATLAGFGSTGGTQPQQFSFGIIQRLDEWGETLTFDKMDVYNREAKNKINLGKDRVRMDVIVPYRMVHGSRGATLYERNS